MAADTTQAPDATYALHGLTGFEFKDVIISIITIMIILVITFMRVIYIHIPETNHVSRVYSIAAVLYLQFMLYVT